jgi:hypothetical protein
MTPRALALLGFVVGCSAAGAVPRVAAPSVPADWGRCKVAANQANPLVTEWPASEKANLESRLREGGVVVAFSGCSMRILPRCQVKGAYGWQRTTVASDTLDIQNEDELYAKLPLGAAALEGELQRTGRLVVQTTVSGQLRLAGLGPEEVPRTGECRDATHVVGSLSVGAFALSSGGQIEGKASAGVLSVGEARGGTKSSQSIFRQAGDPAHCAESTAENPHPDCQSPIQLFLWPIPASPSPAAPGGQTGQPAQEGSPDTIQVSFLAADAEETWEVVSGDRTLCTTPCSQWIPPSRPLLLRVKDRSTFRPMSNDKILVSNLTDYAAQAPLEVRAHHMRVGRLSGGVVAATFAGGAVMAGGIFLAIGCSGDHDGLCTAGTYSLPAGLLGLVPAIWLLATSGARAEVVPAWQRAGTP